MANIIRLKPRPISEQGVATLCSRLRHIETAESPDEGTMEAIADAEQSLVLALAEARSDTLAEIRQKVAVVADRAAAGDGFLSEGELAVLLSAVTDLRRLDPSTAAA
jgi:hypothetical protein